MSAPAFRACRNARRGRAGGAHAGRRAGRCSATAPSAHVRRARQAPEHHPPAGQHPSGQPLLLRHGVRIGRLAGRLCARTGACRAAPAGPLSEGLLTVCALAEAALSHYRVISGRPLTPLPRQCVRVISAFWRSWPAKQLQERPGAQTDLLTWGNAWQGVGRRLGEPETRRVFAQIIDAVDYCHRRRGRRGRQRRVAWPRLWHAGWPEPKGGLTPVHPELGMLQRARKTRRSHYSQSAPPCMHVTMRRLQAARSCAECASYQAPPVPDPCASFACCTGT
jgi:hypothetical protein